MAPAPAASANYKTDKRVNIDDALASFASGSVGGLVCKCLTAPLSRLTILLQVQGAREQLRPAFSIAGTEKVPLHNPLTATVVDLIKKEGMASFWKGNWTSIVHKAGAQGVNYFVFEWSKNQLRCIWSNENDPGFIARTAAGFFSGMVSLTIVYPLDIVRTRLACDTSAYHLNSGSGIIARTLLKMWKEEGTRAFLNGLPCTLLCQGLNVGLCFGIYESMNTRFLQNGETRTGIAETLGCGAVTGLIASSIVHPLDLIRRRQQLCNKYSQYNAMEIASQIVRKEGMVGLYRGLSPELVKVMPTVGLNFYIYEFVRQEVFRMKVNPR